MITLKTIAKLQPKKIIWDQGTGAVCGLCARRQKGDAVVYGLKYRTAAGRQRWLTIGRHGSPWTPDMARARARKILIEVVNGADPAGQKQDARKGATVAELCDSYLVAANAGRILTRRKVPKKASTIATDESRINVHIKPLLGSLKVAAVTRADVERFHENVPGGASRTLGLLGAIFSFSVKRGMRPDNPAHGVEHLADGQRQRRVTDAEYTALGRALNAIPEPTWPIVVSAVKFLTVTGWRRGEMLSLKWSEIDLVTRTARLADTKTGPSMRPLSHAACDILRGLPRAGALAFPSPGDGEQIQGFSKHWARIAKAAALPPAVTPHTLRHSFASTAADLDYSELTIAALLGHAKASVTARYTHHADAVLLHAADRVAERIAELLGEGRGTPSGDVVRLRDIA